MKNILMVCHGNICRSPLAEEILREKAKQINLNIKIDSAGTSNCHISEHPDYRTLENAKNHNLDISNLRARQFSVSDFDSFDFIFVMDSSNHTDIIALARNEEDKRKVEMIMNRVYPNSNMSVPDPYYGSEQGFENVFILLNNACEIIANSLKKSME